MRWVLLIVLLGLDGCARLFFHPDKDYLLTPPDLHVAYRDVYFDASDGSRLHGWFLPAQESAVATVLFLHGNAQNIGAHMTSVYWLTERRFDVFLPDYRGYGASEGDPSFDGIHADAEGALQYLAEEMGDEPKPLIIFGQSLGGSVAIRTVARTPYRHRIKAVIVEGAFASYPMIARDKLAEWWLTWPFQLIPYVTVSGAYDAVEAVPEISPIPLIIIQGDADPIVPLAHAYRLYQAAREPKQLWLVPGGGHIEAFVTAAWRNRLVRYLGKVSKAVGRRDA